MRKKIEKNQFKREKNDRHTSTRRLLSIHFARDSIKKRDLSRKKIVEQELTIESEILKTNYLSGSGLKLRIVSLIKRCSEAIGLYKSLIQGNSESFNSVLTNNRTEIWLKQNQDLKNILKLNLCIKSISEISQNLSEHIASLENSISIDEKKLTKVRTQSIKSLANGDYYTAALGSSELTILDSGIQAKKAVVSELNKIISNKISKETETNEISQKITGTY